MVNLKILRNKHHVSQQKLANHLGVSRSTVAMWETGGSEPSNEMLAQIASFFNITVDELLGIKKETPDTEVSDEDIMFALWGDTTEMDLEDLDDVKRYADFVRERKKKK